MKVSDHMNDLATRPILAIQIDHQGHEGGDQDRIEVEPGIDRLSDAVGVRDHVAWIEGFAKAQVGRRRRTAVGIARPAGGDEDQEQQQDQDDPDPQHDETAISARGPSSRTQVDAELSPETRYAWRRRTPPGVTEETPVAPCAEPTYGQGYSDWMRPIEN